MDNGTRQYVGDHLLKTGKIHVKTHGVYIGMFYENLWYSASIDEIQSVYKPNVNLGFWAVNINHKKVYEPVNDCYIPIAFTTKLYMAQQFIKIYQSLGG